MTVSALLAGADPAAFLGSDDPQLLPEARNPSTWDRLGPRVDDLVARADRLTAEPDGPLPFSAFIRYFRDGDRQEFEAAYFARRRRLEALGLALLSGRGDRFAGALEDALWSVCDEYSWVLPAHLDAPENRLTVDLFAAETASTLAEILGLLGPRLSPEVARRVRTEVEARVLGPYLADRSAWGWETADHNWAAVCGGCLGVAALWLVEDPLRLGRVLTRLGPTFDAYLSGFADDGVCLEGMGYWTYGMGSFTAFAELLRDRSQGRTDLWTVPALVPKLRAVAAFPRLGRIGDRNFARFSDAPEAFRYPPGTTARLTRRLGVPGPLSPDLAESLDDDPCARWHRHLRDFVWTPAWEAAGSESPEVGASWYPRSQWLVARGRLGGHSVGLAAKGGHNGEPHNHNDVGSFQLVAGDDVLIDDLGAGRYDRDSFGPRRYERFINASTGHSVPLVDGVPQAAGRDRRADRVGFNQDEGKATLSLDLAPAYDQGDLHSLVRTFVLTPDGPGRIHLTDRYAFFGPGTHEVTGRFITRLPVRVDGQASAVVTGPRFHLVLRADPVPVEIRIIPVAYTPHRGPDQTAFCLDFVFRTGGPGFETLFDLEVRPLVHEQGEHP